ncbi:MAG: hypothetical protein Q4E39_02515 [bacterium]|nr:hypothetical protein [bacterium]
MKKMNNKGFAVSTMLFGLLIIIVLTIGVTISIMAFNRKNSKEFSQTIVDELESRKIVNFKVGDYIEMTPTRTNARLSTEMTGYISDQSINPSNLNTWIVMKINDDKTIDLISKDASNEKIYFGGINGYQKYIETLNDIANFYQNNKYTVGARYPGYDINGKQTETITDTSLFNLNKAPKESSTDDNITEEEEKQGLGDVGYKSDLEILKTLVNTTTIPKSYWLASRYYKYLSNSLGSIWYFQGRYYDGEVNSLSFHYCGTSECHDSHMSKSVRPIVIINSSVKVKSGTGTGNDPYKLD